MNKEEFLKYGHEFVEWTAEYMENAEKYPVTARISPGDIRKRLPDGPSGDRRAHGNHLQGLPGDHHAGHHPLAASRLVRLFPGQQQPGLRPGRTAHRRASGPNA